MFQPQKPLLVSNLAFGRIEASGRSTANRSDRNSQVRQPPPEIDRAEC
jgi:hypothetical protein